MVRLLKGNEAADKLSVATVEKVAELRKCGIDPTLAIIRVGDKAEDKAYENSAARRAELTGITVRSLVFDGDISQEELISEIEKINVDNSVHGVLILRPLPDHIDDRAVCETLSPEKDVDGVTSGSMAGVFMDTGKGFPPCTAEACMEILDYYGIELAGKKVTVMGRSLVIGKPVAMMAMKANATVTICHSGSRAEDIASAGKNADVIIAAVGRVNFIGADKLGADQVIIDVGINPTADGGVCGDVNFAEAEKNAAMITPVPGGVGNVTSALLMKHVVQAAAVSSGENVIQ